jgi:hypothetical protein
MMGRIGRRLQLPLQSARTLSRKSQPPLSADLLPRPENAVTGRRVSRLLLISRYPLTANLAFGTLKRAHDVAMHNDRAGFAEITSVPTQKYFYFH